MEKALFSITCTTCRARLRVRDEAAIGAILECPKCGSMVHVLPPDGWQGSNGLAGQAAGPGGLPDAESAALTATAAAVAAAVNGVGAAAQPPVQPPSPPGPGTGPAVPAQTWASPTELRWRKWVLVGAASVAGMVLVVGAWSILAFSRSGEAPPGPTAEKPAEEPSNVDKPAAKELEPLPPQVKSSLAPSTPARTTVAADSQPTGREPTAAAAEPEHTTAAEPDGEPTIQDGQDSAHADTPTDSAADGPTDSPSGGAVDKPPDSPIVAVQEEAPPLAGPGEGSTSPGASPEGEAATVAPQELGMSPAEVEARLAETIPQIEFRDTPLGSAIGLLAAMSALPITLDPEAMSQLGVTLRDPVSVSLSGVTVGQILEAVAGSRGLAVVAENGHVLITSPADHRQRLWQRRYTVSDLTGTDPGAVAELAAMVQKLVVPDSWQAAGGQGTIEGEGGALVVLQTGAVHHQVLVFCEKLRNARGKPLRSRSPRDPNQFALATRRDQAGRALAMPVSVNFHQPTPLIDILSRLGGLTETDILVDRLGIGAVGLSDKIETSLKTQEQPLGEVLDELLRPLGLAYRAVDAQTLQVTSRRAVEGRLELEFYPVGPWLAEDPAGAALAKRIKGQVAGSTWSEAGGPGVLYVDRPSGCLIVLQSQPVQVAVERLLGEKPRE